MSISKRTFDNDMGIRGAPSLDVQGCGMILGGVTEITAGQTRGDRSECQEGRHHRHYTISWRHVEKQYERMVVMMILLFNLQRVHVVIALGCVLLGTGLGINWDVVLIPTQT